MTNGQLNQLAEEVREEGYNQEGSMKDLVFDPVTGEFQQIERGSHAGTGEIVTEMTNKGFASDSENLIFVDEEDVEWFLKGGADSWCGFGCEWPGEHVIHLGIKPHDDDITSGRPVSCRFFRSMESIEKAQLSSVGINDRYSGYRYYVLCEGKDVKVFPVDVLDRRYVCSLDEPQDFQMIPSRQNIFARAKGILEVGVLQDKRVMIVGLGSFGSQIAIELAKAGVGHFSLMDFDRVELHNLSRHTATVHDLGRLKTDVIRDAILGKNPYSDVELFPVDINKDLSLLYNEVGKADLVICATDNNTSRFNLSRALVEKGRVGIFGRAITRAEGGDVFRYRPGGPCYCCLVGKGGLQEEEISDVTSARRDGRIAAYVSEEDAEAMVQVGLSSDIEPICNMMVKLSLMELSRGRESGISCLEDELVYDYYMWANRRERHYANWKPMPNAGGYPTIMRWYGARIEKEEGCPICGDDITLDQDASFDTTGMENMEVDFS